MAVVTILLEAVLPLAKKVAEEVTQAAWTECIRAGLFQMQV
eukprot:CAMPEP_0168589850 /NCGR_PEP_ID=MMETSP0420-20121227/6236_1 /TAXON_ID=498008 /ORGANISM="Pessonella sp." /LENGTH=40 /DNA_ID= /DNA_START= /DNA_END= /DNA_ORIENTATION=